MGWGRGDALTNNGDNTTMQRRNFLIGAAGTAIGGSALVGSGAFTSVEADRNVEVNVTDDASAYLGLEAADHPNGNEFVDDDGDTVEVDITETDADGQGLNPNATTTIDNLVEVTNQGTQEGVGIWVDIDLGDIGDGDFTVYAQDSVENDERLGEEKDLEEEAISIDTGESLVVGVEIESADPAEPDGEVTVNADTRDNVWPQNDD